MARRVRMVGALRVGKREATPTLPSHVPGVMEGNARGNFERNVGIRPFRRGARGTARRSTGICAAARNPIDRRMPNLSPP